MEFIKTALDGVFICKPKIHGDHRGYFSETFRADKLKETLNFDVKFCQDNESKSSRGVLRGLHYQLPPFAQSKLVRVISGAVIDIILDIRKGSPTFGKHINVELTEENKQQIFIPRGFAHGFVVLEDHTIFAYKVDNYYSSLHDRGILYNDPDLRIDWKIPTDELSLSEKDKNHPQLKNAMDLFHFSDSLYE